MKINYKRILIKLLFALVVSIAAFVLYFYVQLSGNPIEGWQEKRDVLKIYEDRYGEDFEVTDTSYDYKRGEFSFTMHPESEPVTSFRTTLDEAGMMDAYGSLRAENYIRNLIVESLGSEYEYLEYTFNVYEHYDSPGIMETDLKTRLGMNNYVVDFSWDVEKIDSDDIDAVFGDMVERISINLTDPVGSILIRVGVYDGKDYYHNQTELE
jgi:hypothetical protein